MAEAFESTDGPGCLGRQGIMMVGSVLAAVSEISVALEPLRVVPSISTGGPVLSKLP